MGEDFHFEMPDLPELADLPAPPVPPVPPMPPTFHLGPGRGRKLGLSYQELGDQLARYFKVDGGVLVTDVEEDGPAGKAGIKAGDVIVRVGGKAVKDGADLREALRDAADGSSATIGVQREGRAMDLTVKLGEGAGHGPPRPRRPAPRRAYVKALGAGRRQNTPAANPNERSAVASPTVRARGQYHISIRCRPAGTATARKTTLAVSTGAGAPSIRACQPGSAVSVITTKPGCESSASSSMRSGAKAVMRELPTKPGMAGRTLVPGRSTSVRKSKPGSSRAAGPAAAGRTPLTA